MGDRPITRPESLLESVRLEDDSIETDSFENDSDAATESPLIPGPSKEDTDIYDAFRTDTKGNVQNVRIFVVYFVTSHFSNKRY